MRRIAVILCALALVMALVCPAMAATPGAEWYVPGDFATIQEAIDSTSVMDGDAIIVMGPGPYAGATVTKAIEIMGEDRAVINSGPVLSGVYMTGFLFPGGGDGSGSTISHLRFETVELPVYSKGADDITVEQCTLINPMQGVTNWGGSDWHISHNEITDLRTFNNGGGIGVIIADRNAVEEGVNDNLVSHNKITGTLHVAPGNKDFCGTGIVLYADSRYGYPGAVKITNNRVIKNKISLVSNKPSAIDVVAIELTEKPVPDNTPVIFDNAIGFNDLRGTDWQIELTPYTLGAVNDISRNLGENRGKGLHPSVFGPGGNIV